MSHTVVSNAAFRTEYCFPFFIAKMTIRQGTHGPYASMVVWGKSLSTPRTFITPGHSPLVPQPWSLTEVIQLLSQPLGSKGSSFTSQHRPRRVVGESRVRGSGNEMRSRERMSWAQERAGGRRPPLLSVLLSMARLGFSLLSLSSGPVKGSLQLALAHIKEYWLQRSIELEAL